MKISQEKMISSPYTEDWVPIKGIQNNAIVLNNKEKVIGIKIIPKNIFIMDFMSQDSTIVGLKNLYNTIDFEFWIICADRPVDINAYMAKLQLLYNEISNPAIKRLVSQDIQKAQSFIDNNITDTEYYIMIKDKDNEKLNKKMRTIITGLANSGIDSLQASNDDLRVILDNFLNGGVRTDFGTVTSYVV